MDNNKNIELIILEILGCLNNDDRKNLKFLKETDENFPWKTLAEFQNLSALLPSLLKTTELPSTAAKERMVNRLSQSVSSENNYDQPAKFVLAAGRENESNEQLEAILTKNKIDWGSLSAPKQSPVPSKGYEEVRPKASTVKREFIEHKAADDFKEDQKFIETSEEDSNEENEEIIESSSKLKKYIMVSIILFVISLTLFSYLFIFKQSDTSETLADNKSDEKVVSVPVEEFVYNNVQGMDNTQQSTDVQQEVIDNKIETKPELKTEISTETSSKEKNKSVIPKAPPELPDPIEAPLIETTQITTAEKSKEEEELNVPPPKEVLEESEEPTYFVAVEEMPEPIGGLKAIQEKIVYPELARRAGVQGKVFIRAYVDEKGNVTSAEVIKGIGGGCDEAALDAVLKTKFTPGKQRGKPIKVQVTIPVLFKL